MKMDSQPSPQENVEEKATFRKPLNDAGNRKYRRRSPMGGSSSSEGSPMRDRNSSPAPMRKDPEKGSDGRRRKDEGRELDRDSGRSQYDRSVDSYRHSDRQSSRSSRGYHRHDDYQRRDKYDDRDYSRSSRSSRDSRGNTYYSDRSRREKEYRSRDHPHGAVKYSRDMSDGLGDRSSDKDRETFSTDYQKHKGKDSSSDRAGSGRRHASYGKEDAKSGERDGYKEDKAGQEDRTEHQRSLADVKTKGDHSPVYEDSKCHRNDSTSRRDSSGNRTKEGSQGVNKSIEGEKYTKEEKKNDEDTSRYKEHYHRELEEQYDGKGYSFKDQENSTKKARLSSFGESSADEKEEKTKDPSTKGTSEQPLTDSDIDAAKIAAMKAAELVNKNLVGTGFMSADQKKKLLWANKKTTPVEESGRRWDSAIFGDRERQEKFNKLMSLRLHWYLWPIVGCERGCESRTQTRSTGRGEAKGAPIGSRKAVHCWTSAKRWTDSWSWPLRIYWMFLFAHRAVLLSYFLYAGKRFDDDALLY